MKLTTSIVAIIVNLFYWSGAYAQETVLKELPGTYRNATIGQALGTAPDLNKLKGTDRTVVVNNLTSQHRLLLNAPSLKSFTGMEARLYGYVKPASTFQKRTTSEMRVMLYPFTKTPRTGKVVPVDEAPAFLSLFTNDLNKILFNADEWWNLTNNIKFPLFFNKFPVVDSTSDYMEIKANGKIFRILQLNDKPIFVPLSRKEFMQFLMASAEQQLHEAQKIVMDNRQQAKKAKENKDSFLNIYENNIATWQLNVDKNEAKILRYKNDISQMSPEQASMGAYIDHNKAGDYYDQLAPAGRKVGKALYKVNPDYYNKGKSPSAAQLVVGTYWYHNQLCPEWVKVYTKKLFDEIDYGTLKKEME